MLVTMILGTFADIGVQYKYIHEACIEQRPTIVAQKSRIGDWEGDTIIVKGHQGVCHYLYRA